MKPETRHDCETPYPLLVEESIPTEAECRALWLRFGVPDEVTVHSRMLAELARILALYLERAGLKFNIDLIIAGGYLHDLLDHTGAGAGILRQIGYARISEMLLQHMDAPESEVPDEADLIFLAEWCIEEYRLSSLAGTCKTPLNLHEYASVNIERSIVRINRARIIKDRVERFLGISLRRIIEKHRRGIVAVAVQGIRSVYLLVHGAVGSMKDGACLTAQELPLCPAGIRQAGALREELQEIPLSDIFCCDSMPAIETAKIIAEPHRLEPKVRSGLREISVGEWVGSTPHEVEQLYSRQFGHDMLHFRPLRGETLLECTSRVIPAFYDILNSTSGNMAIVGHAVLNRIILCQVLGLSLERLFELDQNWGTVNHIYCDGPNLRLKLLNGNGPAYNRLN